MMRRAGYFATIITRMVTFSVSLLRSFSTPRGLAILPPDHTPRMERATHRALPVLAIPAVSCLLRCFADIDSRDLFSSNPGNGLGLSRVAAVAVSVGLASRWWTTGPASNAGFGFRRPRCRETSLGPRYPFLSRRSRATETRTARTLRAHVARGGASLPCQGRQR